MIKTMGMNPYRAGGNLAFALTQNGLITTGDVYGVAGAAMAPPGTSGAPASSMGASAVTPVPPTLRGSASGLSSASSGMTVGLQSAFNSIPGGSAVHLVVLAVLAYFALRFVIKEAD